MRRPTPNSGLRTANRSQRRRGSATVEFALVAPLFVALTMGAIETGLQVSAAHTLTSALREAGRLASMDYSSRLQSNQTINQKIILDIQNFLSAEGMNGSLASITITAADGASAGSSFDISNPNNSMKLFKITAVLPSKAISSVTFFSTADTSISASVVFQLVPNSLSN